MEVVAFKAGLSTFLSSKVYICVANCYRWGKSCLTSRSVLMKTWALGDVQETEGEFFFKPYVNQKCRCDLPDLVADVRHLF